MPDRPQPLPPKPLCPENYTATEVARLLALEPLADEGGFFRRTAESGLVLPGGDRRAYSMIYSLHTPEGFSALHRLTTDEIWCFHAGDTVESLRLGTSGKGEWIKLGLDLSAGDNPQNIVSARRSGRHAADPRRTLGVDVLRGGTGVPMGGF